MTDSEFTEFLSDFPLFANEPKNKVRINEFKSNSNNENCQNSNNYVAEKIEAIGYPSICTVFDYSNYIYSINDILNAVLELSPVLYARHMEDFNASYRLAQIVDNLCDLVPLGRLQEAIYYASRSYIVKPKYKSLGLVWIFNNIDRVINCGADNDFLSEEVLNAREEAFNERKSGKVGMTRGTIGLLISQIMMEGRD